MLGCAKNRVASRTLWSDQTRYVVYPDGAAGTKVISIILSLMAKLYFSYSAMNAGKTTTLLQSDYNYRERGMNTLVLKPQLDDRYGDHVRSRIGLESEAVNFVKGDDLYALYQRVASARDLHCVLVDEAQFLQREQVLQLTDVVDKGKVPVLSYGLRTDFRGELFEGSRYLLAWADELREIKTIVTVVSDDGGSHERKR